MSRAPLTAATMDAAYLTALSSRPFVQGTAAQGTAARALDAYLASAEARMRIANAPHLPIAFHAPQAQAHVNASVCVPAGSAQMPRHLGRPLPHHHELVRRPLQSMSAPATQNTAEQAALTGKANDLAIFDRYEALLEECAWAYAESRGLDSEEIALESAPPQPAAPQPSTAAEQAGAPAAARSEVRGSSGSAVQQEDDMRRRLALHARRLKRIGR